MALQFISREDSNHGIALTFHGTVSELATITGDYMASKNYHLKKGTPEAAVYERGNYIVRLLLGAFVAYYKFNINITSEGGTAKLLLSKAHSGFSGGVIGMAKLSKEYKLLAEGLEKADSALGIYATG